jgi:hypothetical protein
VNADGTITLTVNTALATINSAAAFSATKGTSLAAGPGNYQITTVASPSVVAPTAFAIVSGTLAPGLTLNTGTGVISGTPNTEGVFTVGLAANNGGATGGGNGPTFNLTVTVEVASPVLSNAGLRLRVGQGLSSDAAKEQLNLYSDGFYLAGILPPGLTNNFPLGSGFSGIPNTSGTFTSTLTAFNINLQGARLETSAPVQIRIDRGTQAFYGMDGNLNSVPAGRMLTGQVAGYFPDRFDRSNSSVKVTDGGGLVHSNSVAEVVDQFSLSLWFEMPETPIPASGAYLIKGNPAVDAVSLKLIPLGSGPGVRLKVENLRPTGDSFDSRYFVNGHFATPVIDGWGPGSGWHHLLLCVRQGLDLLYLDGVQLVELKSLNLASPIFDINNFSIGGDPWSADAVAFPGEIDEAGIFDIPLKESDLGLFRASEWWGRLYNRNPLGDPTVESLYLHGLSNLQGGLLRCFAPQLSDGELARWEKFGFEKIFDLECGGFAVGGLDSNGRPVISDMWPRFMDEIGDPSIWVPPPLMVSGLAELRWGLGWALGLKKSGEVYLSKGFAWSSDSIVTHRVELRTISGVAVAANNNTAIILNQNGLVDVWHPITEPTSLFPTPGSLILGQTNVPIGANHLVGVAAGFGHCLALDREGRVFAWGDNTSGQCNVPVEATRDVVKISAGGNLSMALTRQGRVVVWGINESSVGSPDAFQGKFRSIDVGDNGSLGALTDDGRLVTWLRGGTNDTLNWPNGLEELLPFFSKIQGVSSFRMGNYELGDSGTTLPVLLQASNVPSWKLNIPLKVVGRVGHAFSQDLSLDAERLGGNNHYFEAIGLPQGVTLDRTSGLLSAPAGLPSQASTVTVILRNDNGMDRRCFSLQGIEPAGLEVFPAYPQEGSQPSLLARVWVPAIWQLGAIPLTDPYEARPVFGGWEIWSRAGLDYENPSERQITIRLSATSPSGQETTTEVNVAVSDDPWEDADGDSVREYFEELYGSSDLLVDSDGDGVPDWQEIQAGFSPKNGDVRPGATYTTAKRLGSSFRFQFHAPIGQWVKIQSSEDLMSWVAEPMAGSLWTDGSLGLEGDGEVWEAEFPLSAGKRFYRALREEFRPASQ